MVGLLTLLFLLFSNITTPFFLRNDRGALSKMTWIEKKCLF